MIIPEYSILVGGAARELSIKTKYPEFYEYICTRYPHVDTFSEKLYWYYNGLTKRPVCKVCGKETVFVNIRDGYREYCSRACLNQDPNKKERVKQTNIRKYGGVAPACSSEVQNKTKQTNLNRYGVENAMQNAEIAQRSHDANIKRYGGMGNSSQELKQKQRRTLQELYGVENYMQSEAFYEDVALRHPDVISVDVVNRRFECKCPCISCTACTHKSYYIPISQYNNRKNMSGTYKCTITNPIKEKTGCTSIELFVRSILDRHNIQYKSNDRTIITPQELDIYIPSKRIAIECNGIYYHNSVTKPKSYHLNKYRLCKQQNIQLLSIWEDWIYKKPEIVESILLSKLGIYTTRLFARKCVVREVSTADANLFLDTYHIQGRCPSDTKLGLYYNDELVSLMTFANHRNNIIGSCGCELVRFCNKFGTQVVGGAKKLLTHYIREHLIDSIYSFSSNDISNGNLYKQLGFVESQTNQSYWYIEANSYKRYHRSSFTKDSIIKRGWKDSKKGWIESEVVTEHGYFQIFDSGQTKWVLNL